MLFSAEQAFVGRDEKRAPLKTPEWEASNCWGINHWFYNYIIKKEKL